MIRKIINKIFNKKEQEDNKLITRDDIQEINYKLKNIVDNNFTKDELISILNKKLEDRQTTPQPLITKKSRKYSIDNVEINNLVWKVLIEPFLDGYDELTILSGYATPEMLNQHLSLLEEFSSETHKKLPIKINLIIGMTPLQLKEEKHRKFLEICRNNKDITCKYVRYDKYPIHSKLYIWCKKDKYKAFMSSANYTKLAFFDFDKNKYKQTEIAVECCGKSVLGHLERKESFFIKCTDDDEVAKLIRNKERSFPLFYKNYIADFSVLNWTVRHKDNDASIFISRISEKPDFFPQVGTNFTVLTKEGAPFVCNLYQLDFILLRSDDNEKFSQYFRDKLSVSDHKLVELKDLESYGNKYVYFKKIGDKQYLMSF